jgi:hemerythrin-like domain-containing protein
VTRTKDPIDILVLEHRAIEKMLDVLDGFGERADQGFSPPRADLAEIVAVLRGYADAYHHAKEEDVLFREMVKAGMSDDDGPIALMLDQHNDGRRLVSELAELSLSEEPLVEAQARDVARLSRDYTALLREHIREEDATVYVLARRMITPSAWDEVVAQCAEIDAMSTTVVQLLLERSAVLQTRYCPTT